MPDYDSFNYGFGSSLANAGDVNGDGFDDLIASNRETGTSYVVFGSEDFGGEIYNFDSKLDGENGFRMVSGGGSVDGAGDFDGDGIDDLIVSSTDGDVFLVLGRRDGFAATLDLGGLSEEFRFTGAAGNVAGAGDLNADGYDDLILGSPYADPRGRHDAGSSFVIYGHAIGSPGSEIEVALGDFFEINDAPLPDPFSTTLDPLLL